jgi:hypothetical protein
MAEKVLTERGSVGKQIFAKVEQLTATGMNKLAAFKRISEASGRAVGTVAANYYRLARQKGTPLRARRRGRPPGRPPGSGGTARIGAAIKVIQDLLRQQAETIDRLQRENARFAEIRRLLASGR